MSEPKYAEIRNMERERDEARADVAAVAAILDRAHAALRQTIYTPQGDIRALDAACDAAAAIEAFARERGIKLGEK